MDPENPVALNNLAFQYAEFGKDLDMAMKFAQKAKQKAPNSNDISDTMGWVYVKKQLNDKAISILQGPVSNGVRKMRSITTIWAMPSIKRETSRMPAKRCRPR